MLGALYLRLVGTSLEVYNYLEPLYNDYRKLKLMDRNGQLQLSHVDEFVDDLLHKDRSCDIILPRIQVIWPMLKYMAVRGTGDAMAHCKNRYCAVCFLYTVGVCIYDVCVCVCVCVCGRSDMCWSRASSWSRE